MYQEFNQHKKSDAVKWIIAFTLIIVLMAGVVAALILSLDKPTPIKPQENGTQQESPEESNAAVVLTLGQPRLMSVKSPALAADNTQQYVSQTVTATITPSTVVDKYVTWSVAWANDAPLKDKNISDYTNDIDLLSLPESITPISKTLRELGFIQGVYDRNSDAIKEFSRTEIIKRRMNRGEVAPFVKKTGNTEFPFIEVDINFSLGNTPSEGSALLREMIENSVEYNGKVPMKVPDGALFFLHLIMHQYKESCLLFMVEHSKDLDLYKLADIYYLLKADILDYERLEMLVKKFLLNQEIGTVLKQVGEIFADDEIVDYAKKFGNVEPFVVDYENKKKYKWTEIVAKRLCSLDSRKYLIEVGDYGH